MSATVVGLLLLLGFFAFDALGRVLPKRAARLPLLAYGAALALVGLEFGRYDHGRDDWLLGIGFVGAPVLVIFAGSAAGARRWYGWPDLGPVPGRLAICGAALLGGILVGSRVHAADVEASDLRGHEVAQALRSWKAAHAAWPTTIEQASPDAPPSRMGAVSPPPFAWDGARATLSYRVDARTIRLLEMTQERPEWRSTSG
jgi:hypothetical protein